MGNGISSFLISWAILAKIFSFPLAKDLFLFSMEKRFENKGYF
jgi:hypothetical protein